MESQAGSPDIQYARRMMDILLYGKSKLWKNKQVGFDLVWVLINQGRVLGIILKYYPEMRGNF